MRTLSLGMLIITFGWMAGCEVVADAARSGPWWQCPPVKAAAGLEHGQKCTQDSDCLYGHCFDGGFLTGYTPGIKFCTKNNNCGSGDSVPCNVDGAYVSAFEKSTNGGNTARTSSEPFKVCGKMCKSDSECAAWNPEMPDCINNSTKYVSVGTQGVCGVNPVN